MYKPPVKNKNFSRLEGVAKVKLSPDGKYVGVQMKPKNEGEDAKVYKIRRENAPENVLEGTWFVSLSSDGSTFFSQRPVTGVFTVGDVEFVSQKDQPPTPRLNGTFGYQYFVVLVTIQEGKEQGMKVPILLHYNFDEGEDENGKAVVAITKPMSKHTILLRKFLYATGVWEDGAISYQDNILPILAKRISKRNKTFKVVMESGFVSNILVEEEE